jgi:REP element-mobilizing transposase RayT
MRHHRLLVHLVWTTRGREPLITCRLAEFLGTFLPAVARQERATILARGIVSTHIHLLLRLDPETDIPWLVQRLKGGSAAIAEKEKHNEGRPLRWAKGYSITSVSRQAVPAVIQYVTHQAQHHPLEAIPGWDNQGPAGSPGAVSRGFEPHGNADHAYP